MVNTFRHTPGWDGWVQVLYQYYWDRTVMMLHDSSIVGLLEKFFYLLEHTTAACLAMSYLWAGTKVQG